MDTNAANDPETITRIKKGPCKDGLMYDNRVFFSHQEVICYKYLRGISIPAKRMHMEYRVGTKYIDFFPLRRVFWEHHPILLKFSKRAHVQEPERYHAEDERHGRGFQDRESA